jgi:hypothetical protein
MFFAIALASNILFSMDNNKSITLSNDGLDSICVFYKPHNDWHMGTRIEPQKKETIQCIPGSRVMLYRSLVVEKMAFSAQKGPYISPVQEDILFLHVDTVMSPVSIYLDEDGSQPISIVYRSIK